jgi:hypothetical protein
VTIHAYASREEFAELLRKFSAIDEGGAMHRAFGALLAASLSGTWSFLSANEADQRTMEKFTELLSEFLQIRKMRRTS